MKINTLRTTSIGTAAIAAIGALALAGTSAAVVNARFDGKGAAARVADDRSEHLRSQIVGGTAENVILLIGDGMGDSEITAARNYALGAAGRFDGIDNFDLTGQYTTFALNRKTGLPEYTTDSAASGTAWATGTKTYNGAVSVDRQGKPLKTLLEMAKEAGFKTGNVTTAEVQDATPAVLMAHISLRGCKGPVKTSRDCAKESIEKGGPGSISEQMLATRPDVIMGGGAKYMAEEIRGGVHQGKTVLQSAKDQGFHVVTDKNEMFLTPNADQQKPVLGLFSAGNMPVLWTGPKATADGGSLEPATCKPNPERPAEQPSLGEMTRKAINLLQNKNPEKQQGFFLQVESASIDKRDHAADACGHIGETLELNDAVKSAIEYAKKRGRTSVFVAADHAHSAQIVYNGSTTPGLTTNLLTKDGATMTMSYGTAKMGKSQFHTGSQLRVAGMGPQAGNVMGLTDQSDLHFTIARALGVASRKD